MLESYNIDFSDKFFEKFKVIDYIDYNEYFGEYKGWHKCCINGIEKFDFELRNNHKELKGYYCYIDFDYENDTSILYFSDKESAMIIKLIC